MKHTSPDISCTDILALSTFFCWTSSCPDSCDVMRAECALWPAPVPIIASAHSAQLPAPMTSDHWLPVLDSPQVPAPAPAHHQWLLSTSIMTRPVTITHMQPPGERALRLRNRVSCDQMCVKLSNVQNIQLTQFSVDNWPALCLLTKLAMCIKCPF